MNIEEMQKEENFEHEVLDRLKCLDTTDFDYNTVDGSYVDAVLKARDILLTAYEKEKEAYNFGYRNGCNDTSKFNDKTFIRIDKLKEILGIEEETDSEKILSLLQTLVDENNRLEDIEDRKVQIEYNNVFNKGVKSVEDKIKAKIEEVEQWELYNMKIPKLSTLDERLGAKIGIKYVLQSLLKRSNKYEL